MTVQEFSNGFDTLVASYRRFKDFDKRELLDSIEFDEYEKSLYLTKAQEDIVLSLYNGRNSSLQSFEETEELRRYLSELIQDDEREPITNSSSTPLGIDGGKQFFSLPDDLWFITYESVLVSKDEDNCKGSFVLDVVPVTQDEYHKIKRNPFRGANGRRALRLDLSDNNIEIVSKYTIQKYYVRYLKKLKPIVLEDLPNGITIGNTSLETPCEVHEGLHQIILERAVQTALQSKLGGMASNNTSKNTNRE